MEVLRAPLKELAAYRESADLLKKETPQVISLTGCADSQKLHMIDGLGAEYPFKLIVTYSDQRIRELYEDYTFYDRRVVNYPAKDLIFFEADIHGNQLTRERMKTLRRLLEGVPTTIITTFSALMTPQIPVDVLREHVLHIDHNTIVEEAALAKRLVTLGYEKVYQVETPGQFSVRGGILDIFDLTEENPYRIELWGDDIESIRSFDATSQRSIENLNAIDIYPATELILSSERMAAGLHKAQIEMEKQVKILRKDGKNEEASRLEKSVKEVREQALELGLSVNLESYIKYFFEETSSFLESFTPGKLLIVIDEPVRVREHAQANELEFRESMSHRLEKGYLLPGQTDLLYGMKQVGAAMSRFPVVMVSALEMKNPVLKPTAHFDVGATSIASYHNSFATLVSDLKRYKKNGYRVLLLSGSRTRAKRLAQELVAEGLTSFYTEDPDREIMPGEVETYYGHAQKGFIYRMIKFVVITEGDIFGAEKKKKRKQKKYEGQKIQNFADLKVGDYVVHESFGLGIYQGIIKFEVDHVVKDYMKIEYRDGGNLYVLATNFQAIQKYASADAKRPKLNKLGTQEWNKTKSKVKSAVGEVAEDLVRLYANRQQENGYVYGADTVWQREFEEMFPFEETEDQLAAIEATKADMQSHKIMDRLICGDVGFGKTEVAIRAAFKAVQENKQVALLVPTTILAQQHFHTFLQRMSAFPVRIEMLSRFRTAAEQKKILQDLGKGMVDIVIGTHRLLSADVKFKDLGLLIIDEEQRFGVTHKEKIKKLRENIDVLTLTATPIPRTLHMSLIGIRDMSVLEEAPEERLPIQTFVCEYNEELVREAITRELSRGGQVFYLYNQVNNIADIAAQIGKLVPEATVAFAHGQMKEQELEKLMMEFVEGEIDVLVTTTIIETGLDIPNTNTIIIHDSDRMGLSQLYQLRGRVGRSNRNAYAFFLY
nr:transcription-repair coupling factor [Lachnospiraceae bacterium]